MNKPKLYLFVGYPGAGKTTVARLIADATNAVHIWTDQERHAMFGKATHAEEESNKLYEHLNNRVDRLLSEGKSVIFDTNFNFRSDRKYLADIAAKHHAETVIVWMTTPKEVAKRRALDVTHHKHNGYDEVMSAKTFESLSNHLEEPGEDEHPIKLDGTDLDIPYAKRQLDL